MVQSEQHMIYRLMAGEGQGGPSYYGRKSLIKCLSAITVIGLC